MNESKFTNWRKSRRSGGGDNCVQVAFATDGAVGVRDSKNPTGPILEFSPTGWVTFVGGVRDGDFDA